MKKLLLILLVGLSFKASFSCPFSLSPLDSHLPLETAYYVLAYYGVLSENRCYGEAGKHDLKYRKGSNDMRGVNDTTVVEIVENL